MFRQNVVQFYRNIKKDKSSFLINLGGLSIGLACTLLIYLWVQDEVNIDKFHENNKRLYQVVKHYAEEDGAWFSEYMPGLIAKAMREEIPEIEFAAMVVPINYFDNKGVITHNKVALKANEQFVGNDYFKMFSFKLIDGSRSNPFPDIKNVMLSDELAHKLFGTTKNLIGKTIHWNRNNGRYTDIYSISGIFEKPTKNSTEKFDLLFSYDLFFEKDKHNASLLSWQSFNPYTYVLLREGTNVKFFNEKIKDFIKNKDNTATDEVFVRPYSEKYLKNNYENGKLIGGRIAYVRLFSTIAIFILLIACINFMNLSTAKALRRVKDVGIKKSIGADRVTLAKQYIGESIILSFLALTVAIFIVIVALPYFNELTHKEIVLSIKPGVVLTTIGIALATGILSGVYPAIYITAFKPAKVLKGTFTTSFSESFVRKGLVVFQFGISIVLITCVIAVYKQMQLLQNKNLGFEKGNVIHFLSEGEMRSGMKAFMAELNTLPGVNIASNSYSNLIDDYGLTTNVTCGDWNLNRKHSLANAAIGYGFFETLGMKILEGESFTRTKNNSNKLIINESAVKLIGLKEPVGRIIEWNRDKRKMEIIGIVKDFHFESLHEDIKPAFFRLADNGENIWVRIEKGAEFATIDKIEKLYSQFNPGLPFEFTFIANEFQALYEAERRVAYLSRIFSFIAVILSCLGLFALATFTAQKRFKEIGVRKVHGSTEAGVVGLLTSDFIRPIIISILIAVPISSIILARWLDIFAYRIELNWWIFAIAGLFTLILALSTVSIQAFKAANLNPVICLKDE